jgi:hypothetical protein
MRRFTRTKFEPAAISGPAGQTLTFMLGGPGSYTFERSMPSHAIASMRGALTAQ